MRVTLVWASVLFIAIHLISAVPLVNEYSNINEKDNKTDIFNIIDFFNETENGNNTKQSSPKKCPPICTSAGCIHAASNVLKNMDPSVDPCDDFYQFACGGFLKKTSIPDDKSIVISFNIISDVVEEQLRAILEEPVELNQPKPFVLLKKLYNICLNTTAIEEDGLKHVKEILKKLGGWPVLDGLEWNEEEFDWKDTMYKFREMGLPTYIFFSMYVGLDTKNTTRRVINFDQAILSLDREYLMEGFENDMVMAYYEYLVDLAVIFGADRSIALKDIQEAVRFEMKLAAITLPKEQRRNFTALYNPMTVAELQKRFPSIFWLEYINNIVATDGVEVTADEMVDVGVPKFISDLEILLINTEKRVQANYVMTYTVKSIVSALTKELRNRELKYREITDGTRAMKPRWKECVNIAASEMKIAAGALYVRKYFNEEARKNARTLVSDLQSTFMDILKNVDWMDGKTKKDAIEKLIAMNAHIAYPPELLDDKKLEEHYRNLESANNYLEFALNIRKFMDNNSFKKLREPVNKTDWVKHSAATKVNAYYSNSENSIQLPAGILQGAFFDNNRPHYMNYGAMGYVIGHEITHGFDDIGRQYNKDGELSEWWAEKTKQAFMRKAQCIIDQYSNYTAPELAMNLNGINTQSENIADNGGIKEAYLAYQTWVERNGEEPLLPGLNYTPTQMFWISSANLWCSTQRNEYLRQHIMTDSHSPSYYRVLGSFSNSKYFAEDFHCPEASPMNPKSKCQVW